MLVAGARALRQNTRKFFLRSAYSMQTEDERQEEEDEEDTDVVSNITSSSVTHKVNTVLEHKVADFYSSVIECMEGTLFSVRTCFTDVDISYRMIHIFILAVTIFFIF